MTVVRTTVGLDDVNCAVRGSQQVTQNHYSNNDKHVFSTNFHLIDTPVFKTHARVGLKIIGFYTSKCWPRLAQKGEFFLDSPFCSP